ncbi:MAG: Gfo/Idh/MocA family oxidoreductase [Planctomycetales bacterium]|nr:Gfo/Idh/MocA family oxidoreductase [Planctomycetales bacterium]
MSVNHERRQFLRLAAAASSAAVFAPTSSLTIPSSCRAQGPNEKLNVGCIGVAAQGEYNLSNVATENIVALCDIDSKRLAKAADRFPQAATYADFRKLLDRNDLDAVVVATPDHTHAVATVRALQKGLDVYCEKPLTHTAFETRRVREWTAKQKAVTQMGTQIHAGDNYRRVVEAIQAGMIGPVHRVHVWMKNTVEPAQRVAAAEPPEHVDYDLWTGPAPLRPYHPSHFHFNWRWWWDFGGGTLGDFGCHYMDLPFWALGLRYPTSVEAVGSKGYEGDNEPPDALRIDYHFPSRDAKPPVHMTWYHGEQRPGWTKADFGRESGVLFEGERGRLVADYGSHQAYLGNDQEVQPPPQTIAKSIGHHQEWIKACKERSSTTCNFDYSGALTESVHLGNVAYRAGQRHLRWDAEAFRITNHAEANDLLHQDYRQGWTLEG